MEMIQSNHHKESDKGILYRGTKIIMEFIIQQEDYTTINRYAHSSKDVSGKIDFLYRENLHVHRIHSLFKPICVI